MSTPALVVLIVIAALIVLAAIGIPLAYRRARRIDAERREDLTTQGAALGLTFIGDDPTLADRLGQPPILPSKEPGLHNVLRGTRRGRLVTVFDYTWLVHTKDQPRWNVELTGDTNFPILTCALAVVAIVPRAALPSFLLQPNETARFRAQAERAAAVLGDHPSGVLGTIVQAASALAHAMPEDAGLRFPDRPAFHEEYLLTGDNEPRLRALFDEKTIDTLLSKPGWIVNAANNQLFLSVLLSRWRPTQPEKARLDTVRLLPPQHLPALVDDALDIAGALESGARRSSEAILNRDSA